MTKKQILTLLVLFIGVSEVHGGMLSDNRYFPFQSYPVGRTLYQRSVADIGAFFTIANGARGDEAIESIGIPELMGIYDQKQISDALLLIGKTTPLLAEWQLQKTIPWQMYGKIAGQGFYFRSEIGFDNGLSLGFLTSAMHVSSVQRFTLPAVTIRDMNLQPSQIVELDSERRAMNDLLGLTGAQWSQSGTTDTMMYGRYGLLKEYVVKCRKVDAGVFGGFIWPTGILQDTNNPASVPFGSIGRSMIFFGADGAFEVKEDWEFGLTMQLYEAFSKTQVIRMPVNYEPLPFGALVGPAKIDPGSTFFFSTWFSMADLREGFGASLQYTATVHGGDVYTDKRSDQTIPTTLNYAVNPNNPAWIDTYRRSQWVAEYICINAFYDPNWEKRDEKTAPVFNFKWNIPVKILGAEKVSKTNFITVGLEYHF